jgi:hypothetical protein
MPKKSKPKNPLDNFDLKNGHFPIYKSFPKDVDIPDIEIKTPKKKLIPIVPEGENLYNEDVEEEIDESQPDRIDARIHNELKRRKRSALERSARIIIKASMLPSQPKKLGRKEKFLRNLRRRRH